jgi:hypothetical protein
MIFGLACPDIAASLTGVMADVSTVIRSFGVGDLDAAEGSEKFAAS